MRNDGLKYADMRNYKDAIKEAVKRETKDDEYWNWTVHSLGKKEVKIAWGYITWLNRGKKVLEDMFKVSVWVDDMNDVMVVGVMPNGFKEHAWVGEKHWHDCTTIDDGIKMVIHSMALSAQNTY